MPGFITRYVASQGIALRNLNMVGSLAGAAGIKVDITCDIRGCKGWGTSHTMLPGPANTELEAMVAEIKAHFAEAHSR